MKILHIDTDEYCGIRCLDSDSLIIWDDEDIVNAIEGSCVLAVVSSVCPDACAVGELPLSDAWAKHYAEHESDSSLEDMIQSADMDAVAIQVVRSGMACGPYHETTYFLIPNDTVSTRLCSSDEKF